MFSLIQNYINQAAHEPVYWWSAVLLIFVALAYTAFALMLSVIDIKKHRLPDKIVLPMYPVLGLPLLTVHWIDGNNDLANKTGFAGMFLLGCYWVLRKLSRNALGFGDVKLAGALGIVMGFFSPINLLWGTLLTFVSAGVFSLILLMRKKASLKTHIAFGPFMLLGTMLAMLFPVVSL